MPNELAKTWCSWNANFQYLKKEKRSYVLKLPRQLQNVILFPEHELILESGQLSQIRFGFPGKNDFGDDL